MQQLMLCGFNSQHYSNLDAVQLDGERALPGIVLHASRGLVSLWSATSESPATPEVGLGLGLGSSSHGCVAGATWVTSLQEYSLRGESMK